MFLKWVRYALIPVLVVIALLWVWYATLILLGFWSAPLWALIVSTAWWLYERKHRP